MMGPSANDQADAGAEDSANQQQHQQPRNRQHEIGEAHDPGIGESSVITGEGTQQGACQDRHQRRQNADAQTEFATVHEATQLVSSQLVGTHRVGNAGWLTQHLDVWSVRRVRREPVGEAGAQRQHQHDRQPEHRRAVASEAAPCTHA